MFLKKVISSVFLLLLVFLSACNNTTIVEPKPEPQPPIENNTPKVDLTTYRRGAENPKVVLEEYSDFFCPHCAHVQPILELLLEDFPDTLALEFHAYSFMGSKYIHVGNECAGEQDKYWEFQDKAFQQQYELRLNGESAIIDIAESIDLDTKAFKTCLESNKYLEKIEQLKDQAVEKYDINATPSFIIDGKHVEIPPGKDYYEGLKEIIEQAINKPLA